MSYDLLLTAPRAALDASARALLAWVIARPRWTMPEGGAPDCEWLESPPGEAFYAYENEDTRVGFEVYLATARERADHAAFAHVRVNLVRPRPFRLEAARELADLIADLRCGLLDLRPQGLGRGPFRPDVFARAWDAANLRGLREVLVALADTQESSYARVVLGEAEIERTWRWSDARTARERELLRAGIDRFLPCFLYGTYRDRSMAMVTWSNGPTILPRADYALIDLGDSGPDAREPTQTNLRLVPWATALPFLGAPSARFDGEPTWQIDGYPAALRDRVRDESFPSNAELCLFDLEHAMEREVLELAQRLGPPRRKTLAYYPGSRPVTPGRKLH